MWDSGIVEAFDAELYLRLIGEQMLLDRGNPTGGPWRPPISEAAGALVAIGVIPASQADAVLDDYSLAAALRNDPHFRRRTMLAGRSHRREGKPLKPRRMVPCERTIEQPHATVHVRWVSLTEDATSVAVMWRPDTSLPWSGAGPPQATLSDDRGTAEAAHFVGSGSNEGMLGTLTTVRPLAPDTAWIELDGTRLELTSEASGFDVSLERLPEQNPAHRYLWCQIAWRHELHGQNSIEPAIDALVAAGALSADDPLLDGLRAVTDAMQPSAPGAAPGMAHQVGQIPESWRSLLVRQGRRDGPTGSIVLGAVTPVFEGFSVAVLDLRSDREAFQVEVEVSPTGGIGHPVASDWSVQPRQLAWWARDDRGNHYLGHTAYWSSNGNYGQGSIGFRPALDPSATQLEILPTAETTRAVIGFSLRWATEPAGADRMRR